MTPATLDRPLRIACVGFLNTAPLVEGLSKLRGITLVPTVPSRIGEMVWNGDADVGLASIIDAVRSPVPLALLPVGMIGCDGPTLTVRLFSRVPWNHATMLHADTDSHTSVALAQVILHARFGVRPKIIPFSAHERAGSGSDAARDWPPTVLLIGDKVVTDRPPADVFVHELDLGQAWKEWTGMPFLYATWMCRADAAATDRIRTIGALLDRQRRHNATRLDWIARTHAPGARWEQGRAIDYLAGLLRFEAGDLEKRAVARFMDECAALGLVVRRDVAWADIVPVVPA